MKQKYYYYLFLFYLFLSCSYSKEIYKPTYRNDLSRQRTVFANQGGVCSIHPLASKVGIYILQQGGNAVDAAIAMQLALAVVYPQAGNIGGGGFMVMRLADGTTRALDFREMAPAGAHANMYIKSNGELDAMKSIRGHLASGVPGTIAGLFESMQYARLPFRTLIAPAIDLAENGYCYRLDVTTADGEINTMPNVFDGKIPWEEGDTLIQMDLANTLKRIRDHGRDEFYEGKTAKLIVEEMNRGGGIISSDDLKKYKAIWREPIQFNYRGYDIISMPLPSSGGILINQMLKMIEPFPIESYGAGSVAAINLMIEAERRAFYDRARYLGDGDFVSVPIMKLTSTEYLQEKMSDFVQGAAGVSKLTDLKEKSQESYQTTNLSVVDKWGNTVVVTTTLNTSYGSGVVVGKAGFFLNNQMNDFNIKTGTHNASGGIGGVNNAIAPGKRMLSSMSPTIVLKEGQLFMILGTPGGTTIPTSVFQTIVNVIDFKMTATEATMFPKFHHEWWPDEVAIDTRFSKQTVDSLVHIGYKIRAGGFSMLEVIKISPKGEKEIVSQWGSAEGY